jgi:hypothetical protein
MPRFSKDPRVITAKFDSVCKETGKAIKKGDECLYYPLSKDVFCLESNEYVSYCNWKMDDEVLNSSY